jgi:anti-sigma regulatory factor (Ser/Thr protein kinase)
MDVVLRSMFIPSDIISALEWSISEICDNVINHSESMVGGFVEVITFPRQGIITFTVADAGRGILGSLKEAIPTLRTDAQAIGEAIKAGVTRNKAVGQGNGLAGSLRITTMTGGSMATVITRLPEHA